MCLEKRELCCAHPVAAKIAREILKIFPIVGRRFAKLVSCALVRALALEARSAVWLHGADRVYISSSLILGHCRSLRMFPSFSALPQFLSAFPQLRFWLNSNAYGRLRSATFPVLGGEKGPIHQSLFVGFWMLWGKTGRPVARRKARCADLGASADPWQRFIHGATAG